MMILYFKYNSAEDLQVYPNSKEIKLHEGKIIVGKIEDVHSCQRKHFVVVVIRLHLIHFRINLIIGQNMSKSQMVHNAVC